MIRTSALLTIFSVLTACVTGADSSEMGLTMATLGVILTSDIAKDNATTAQQSWCSTLAVVHAYKTDHPGASEDERNTALTNDVYLLARKSGYSLHPIQIRALLNDADAVDANPAAAAEARTTCSKV